jgi:hypothetical protein
MTSNVGLVRDRQPAQVSNAPGSSVRCRNSKGVRFVKKNWLLLVAVLSASVVACGAPPPPGSCQQTSAGISFCIDYSGSAATMSTVQSGCSMAMGTYSAGACATADRVGRCTVALAGANITQTINYYGAANLEVARTACMSQMGTFAEN